MHAALYGCEDDLIKAKAELKDCRKLSNVKLSQELTAENKRLREQALCMRGEVLRLQAQIEDVKSSAMQAMQALQILSPQPVSMGELMSGMGAVALGQLEVDAREAGPDDDSTYDVDLSPGPVGESKLWSVPINSPQISPRPSASALPPRDIPQPGHAWLSGEVTDMVDGDESRSELSDGPYAMLSPAVEEKLLRVIFSRYDSEKSGRMNLTRFANQF